MIEQILKMYQKLEAIDIRILLDVNAHYYRNMKSDLKKRQSCIDAIQDLINCLAGSLACEAIQTIHSSHKKAAQRNRVIMAVVQGLKDESHQHMMHCVLKNNAVTVYQKKSHQRRIVV
ncbi:MAG: hypothetical protein HQM16_03395 [Deltaproteobacteria bacterium]|nr:hypothetical protein [Deltaproteobacteria bacterium]